MEDESVAPPETCKFFFKENSFPKDGTLWVSLNGDRKDVDAPFYISHTSLEGQIYRVQDLLEDGFMEQEDHKKYSGFLSELTVFTTWYAHESGLIDRFGNQVPRFA